MISSGVAMLEAAVWLASLPLLAATLLPFWRRPYWWVRIWDYPRLQLAAGLAAVGAAQAAALPVGPAAGGGAVAWPGTLLLAATLLCLGWQTALILPYTVLYRRQVAKARRPDPANCVTLLIANVLQDNRRADLLLALVRETRPDVVLTLESNGWWGEQLQEALLPDFPHAVQCPLENTYGMHLFSRLELRGAVVRERVTKDIPSISARLVLRSGRRVNLHCLHPEPPQVGNDVAERDAELLLVAKEVAGDGRPTIVCGDLNDVAWSYTTRLFQRLSGLRDPRVGRGLFPTFHAERWYARWPLDHLFHDPSFRLLTLRVLPYFGSDHFAILVGLCQDPRIPEDAEPPEADEADHEEAAEKIAEGHEAAAEAAREPGISPPAASVRRT
jgi:endonuclease/exonuclease/phosphatase (EEP) superfamily protein YafD